MLAKVRSAMSGKIFSSDSDLVWKETAIERKYFLDSNVPAFSVQERDHYSYSRPDFLHLSSDEIALSADQTTRPILSPKDPSRVPVYAGYAEVINAGKTERNEDQSSARILRLIQQGSEAEEAIDLAIFDFGERTLSRPNRTSSETRKQLKRTNHERKYSNEELLHILDLNSSAEEVFVKERAEAVFFAIFDGHAGSGAAIMAANCLHEHVRGRLNQILEAIIQLDRQEAFLGSHHRPPKSHSNIPLIQCATTKCVSRDNLVIGALETAFVDMDAQIAGEKVIRISGGCTAIVALFFLSKLYIANAGDCRALLLTNNRVEQVSNDCTPYAERKRLQFLAHENPDLIGNHFSRYEYSRCLTKRDLKRKVLYRDWFMDGWAVKTVLESDLRPSMICDRGKKHLLNTIGVSRGFGDHNLVTVDEKLPVKPFLSAVPQVHVVDLSKIDSLSDKDVLILASDGIWNVINNEDAARIVKSALSNTVVDVFDKTRYMIAAHELVIAARGNPSAFGRWQMSSGGHASFDDITAFVIPLKWSIPQYNMNDDEELLG